MSELIKAHNSVTGEVKEKLTGAMTQIQESKAIASIQGHILMAKRFPRDENQAYADIMQSCKRISLADQATYNYPRGGKMVTGASIRLAEVLARQFGNIHIEISILNQTSDKTEAMATAIDMQNNYISSQGFVVPHQRTTKQGVQRLTDERDIRELVQNIGSRILRGCILRVIPSDFTEDALEQCKKTQASSDVPISEQIKKMIVAFDELGIKVEHLEKRLGHNMDATIASEIVTLKGVYRSIKDGFANREDFFDIAGKNVVSEENLEKLVAEKNAKAKPKEEPKAAPIASDEFNKIKKQLLAAKSSETLDIAADLITTVEESNREELREIYNKRKKELS